MQNKIIDRFKQQSNSFKAFAIVGSVALLLAVGITSSLALFTDQKTVVNTFEMNSDFGVEIIEPSFVSEDATNVVPLQVIPKDPQVKNSGSVDIWAIAQVSVPIFSGEVVDNETGAKETVSNVNLYNWTVNTGWTEHEVTEKDGVRTYTYFLTDPVAANTTSVSIFDSVQLINLTESSGITTSNIPVTGYAIQKEGLEDIETAWDAYKKQNGIS